MPAENGSDPGPGANENGRNVYWLDAFRKASPKPAEASDASAHFDLIPCTSLEHEWLDALALEPRDGSPVDDDESRPVALATDNSDEEGRRSGTSATGLMSAIQTVFLATLASVGTVMRPSVGEAQSTARTVELHSSPDHVLICDPEVDAGSPVGSEQAPSIEPVAVTNTKSPTLQNFENAPANPPSTMPPPAWTDDGEVAPAIVAEVAILEGDAARSTGTEFIRNGREIAGGLGDDHIIGSDLSEHIVGDGGNDTLEGAGGDDLLDGGDGADVLVGGAGEDTLLGGDDDDLLDGGVGADFMAGGDGNDRYIVDEVGDVVIEFAGEGHDVVETSLERYALEDNVEHLAYVGTGNFVGAGNDGSNFIQSGDGDDHLFGFRVSVVAFNEKKGSIDVEAIENLLTEVLGSPQDVITFQSTPADRAPPVTQPVSQETAEITIGSRSNDVIVGSLLDNDIILAGKGNDTIEGGSGNDVLTGGEGHDVFVFRAGFGSDVITDFGLEGGDEDLIVLSHDLFADEEDLASNIHQEGADVVIYASGGTDQITLRDTDKFSLSLNDHFQFI